jgi:hypothetical protein
MDASTTSTSASYAVPSRFGMAGILAITTFMAVLFGILRYMNAPGLVYVFLGLLSLVTCLVQMRYGDVPRKASIIAGAITLPTCMVGGLLFVGRRDDMLTVVCSLPFLTLAGAGSGYVAGACTAGIFLLMDLVEPYLPGGGHRPPRYARPAGSTAAAIKMAGAPSFTWVMAKHLRTFFFVTHDEPPPWSVPPSVLVEETSPPSGSPFRDTSHDRPAAPEPPPSSASSES